MSKRLTASKTLLSKVEEWVDLPNQNLDDESFKKAESKLEKDIAKWANRVIHYDQWGAW